MGSIFQYYMPSTSRGIGISLIQTHNQNPRFGTIITAPASYKNKGLTESVAVAARQGKRLSRAKSLLAAQRYANLCMFSHSLESATKKRPMTSPGQGLCAMAMPTRV